MKYHIYKRKIIKNKKEIIQWYYWYYDENKRQIRKSCGTNNKPCLLKRDAEAFISKLEEEDKIKEKEINELKKVRLKDIAQEMFSKNSTYLKLYQSRGIILTPQTIKAKISLLEKYIIPEFGERDVTSIVDCEIEDWLINLDLSNSSKNNILAVFNEVLIECKRNKIINYVPEIKRFKRNSKKKDIITLDEIKKLFPNTPKELEEVWKTNKQQKYIGIDGLVHSYDFMFGLIFKLILVTGMRLGEVIALSISQYKENGFIINRMIDVTNKLQFHLKKGSVDNTKSRAVIIPQNMTELLNYYIKIRPNTDVDFLFTYNGSFVRKRLIQSRFTEGLIKNNIFDSKRKITPHSLRFTYNTFMVNAQFPQEALRKMIGHTSEEMTDYYTRPDMDSALNGLQIYKDAINHIWN